MHAFEAHFQSDRHQFSQKSREPQHFKVANTGIRYAIVITITSPISQMQEQP